MKIEDRINDIVSGFLPNIDDYVMKEMSSKLSELFQTDDITDDYGRKFYRCDELPYKKHANDSQIPAYSSEKRTVAQTNKAEADLIGSEVGLGQHCPVIDIDHSIEVVPSLTEGHYHLYIHKPITSTEYRKILNALEEASIVQKGFVNQFDQYGQTFVRTPERVIAELDEQNNGEQFSKKKLLW